MKSKLLSVLAFAALLLGVTTACNRNRIDIEVLEKDLVGLWWDEYEYAGVSFYLRLPKGASQLRVRPALAF